MSIFLAILAPSCVMILIGCLIISDWYKWNKGICRDTNEPWNFVRITAGNDVLFVCRGHHLRVLWFERRILVRRTQVHDGIAYWNSNVSLQDMQTSINSLSAL